MTNRTDKGLPEPDADARAHSDQVVAHIRGAIAAGGGAIAFDDYMASALYAPGLGYYSAGQARFGRGGDYVTAPLISELFARTLARQVAEVLALTGGEILELGAGTGHMAADILNELERLDALPKRFRILEVSASLRAQQATTLAERAGGLAERVQWLNGLPDEPIHGVILANEVMDAVPVKRFRIDSGEPREIVVTDDAGLQLDLADPAPELARAVERIQTEIGRELPGGYTSEWSPSLAGWLGSLSDSLGHGAALVVDYGFPRGEYYHPQRGSGTLVCHYRHHAHDDALLWPGLQDISAFVDFTRAAGAASEAGLTIAGYNTQAHFLMGAGLPQLLEELGRDDPERAAALTQESKQLVMPGEMGEKFKVLGVTRGDLPPLAGFSQFDHSARL